MMTDGTHWEAAQALRAKGTPFAVVTLLATRGHAPQDVGAKAVITREGLWHGTVGGGKVEKRAIEYAQGLLAAGAPPPPQTLVWNLQRDIGMTCGGEVTFLFEVFDANAWRVVVFGAGHVAQALTRLLTALPCQVTCVDARAEWVERLAPAGNFRAWCQPEPAKVVPEFPAGTFYAVMTQGHATDVPILEAIFRHDPAPRYVGVIGSETKGGVIRKELRERGVSDEFLKRLRCPIGLKLGSNQPMEIAVSVVAEMLQVRDL